MESPRLIDRPSFKQEHAATGVLSQSRRQHRPGGAATNIDHIRDDIPLHRFPPLMKLL
jgi:hypothetical protein